MMFSLVKKQLPTVKSVGRPGSLAERLFLPMALRRRREARTTAHGSLGAGGSHAETA